MTVDFNSLVYGPVYAAFGVPATLAGHPVTVIDQTSGAVTAGPGEGYAVEPAVLIRLTELAERGITDAMLVNASLVVSGTTYEVADAMPETGLRGGPTGEKRLILRRRP